MRQPPSLNSYMPFNMTLDAAMPLPPTGRLVK